jgi:hypothetical protein
VKLYLYCLLCLHGVDRESSYRAAVLLFYSYNSSKESHLNVNLVVKWLLAKG